MKKKRSFKQKKAAKVSKIKSILTFLIRLILLPFFLIYELLKKLLIKIPILILDKLKLFLHKLKLFVFKKPIKKKQVKTKKKYYDDGKMDCNKCKLKDNDHHTKNCPKKKSKKKPKVEYQSNKLETISNEVEGFIKKIIFKIKYIIKSILNKIKSVLKEIILILKYIKNKILVSLSKISYYFNRKLNKSINNQNYKIPKKKIKKPRLLDYVQDDISYSESISEDEIVLEQYHKPINDELPTFEIIKTVTYPSPPAIKSRPKQFSINCTNAEIYHDSSIEDYFKTFDAVEIET